jgi:hypothetical protein
MLSRERHWLSRTMEHVQSMDFDLACEPQLDDGRFAADLTIPDRAHEILAGKGLRCEDKPFKPCLTLRDPDATLTGLGHPACADPAVTAAMHAFVANLIWLVQMAEGAWIFYSRDNDHYAQMVRYVPDFYRRKVMVGAVVLLEGAGLIVHQQTRPCPRARYRSRIRPTDSLRAWICALPVTATVFSPREIIVLRGANGELLQYRDTASTCAMRRDVMAQNSFLERFNITVRHPEARYDALGLLVIGDLRLNSGRNSYHRVFNGRFTRGGRWFGPWWQSVPSRIRQGITINGEPTSEPDIQGCHMRLLCARAGVDLGDGDPYAGLDLPRDEVKLAINIMLNARNWPSARGALISELSIRHGPSAGIEADLLRAAVRIRFPALEPFWTTGYGLILQNIDATICMRLQRRLRNEGVPSLSIHDSYVVPKSAHDRTVTLMEEEFDRARRQLRQPC